MKCHVFRSVGIGGGVAVSAVCVTNTTVVQLGLSVCRVVLLVIVHVLLLDVLSRSLVMLIWSRAAHVGFQQITLSLGSSKLR